MQLQARPTTGVCNRPQGRFDFDDGGLELGFGLIAEHLVGLNLVDIVGQVGLEVQGECR